MPNGSTPTDPPRPPRLLDAVSVFRYVAAENAPNYRAIVEVFARAREHYQLELRPADVRDGIARLGLVFERPPDADPERHLEAHLEQLVAWRNLLRSHDTGSVTRLDDFYRRRFLYRLTPAGEAAHSAVLDVEATVGRSGSLQTAMLAEIRDALDALATSAETGDAPGIVRALHRLNTAFESLTGEADLFLSELDRQAAVERLDSEKFLGHKHALLGYLGRFIEDLRRLRPGIDAEFRRAEAVGPERFLAVASAAGALPPAPPGEDPRGRWMADERARWEGIRAWFLPGGGARPRVERLHDAARAAVVKLTRSLERLVEQRARLVDRAASFRTLARWFSECPTDDDAHALWASAFGLHPARHFALAEDDPERVRADASWWDAEPVEVPVRLRTHGAVARTGRTPAALDFSDGRTWMAAVRRRERDELDAALSRFAGRGAQRLSAVGALSAGELGQLLALLDEALVAPRDPSGERRARSADGRHEIVLAPPVDGAWVVLDTAAGRLRCLDYALQVVPASGRRTAAAGEGT